MRHLRGQLVLRGLKSPRKDKETGAVSARLKMNRMPKNCGQWDLYQGTALAVPPTDMNHRPLGRAERGQGLKPTVYCSLPA